MKRHRVLRYVWKLAQGSFPQRYFLGACEPADSVCILFRGPGCFFLHPDCRASLTAGRRQCCLVFWDLGGTWTENATWCLGWFTQLGESPAELTFGFSLRAPDSSGREGAASVSGTLVTGWSELWSDEKGLSCCGFTPL